MGIFQQLNERGITIIMVTHEQDIANYAQRNVVMRDGVVLSDGLVKQRLNATREIQNLATPASDDGT
jgi:putative ABC transport system ATP-binding protein